MLAQLRQMPPGIRIFLVYAFLVLAGIGVSLPAVIEQATTIPISFLGVVVMSLLAYTIFTITLTLQRKEAARTLALGLSSLVVPAVPLLGLSGFLPAAGILAAMGLLLLGGLTRPNVRTWLNEP